MFGRCRTAALMGPHIEGRMVVIAVAHVDQVDFAQAQVSASGQIRPWLQKRFNDSDTKLGKLRMRKEQAPEVWHIDSIASTKTTGKFAMQAPHMVNDNFSTVEKTQKSTN